MASLINSAKVDWDLVDEELDRVPEEFKDPRFDSLRHVLDILSAVDAEAALEEVLVLMPHCKLAKQMGCSRMNGQATTIDRPARE